MMRAGQTAVLEPEDVGAARSRRTLKLVALGGGTLVLFAFGSGFVMARLEKGDAAWGPLPLAIMAGTVVAFLLCGWLLARTLQTPSGEEPLTAREKMNRNILIGSAVLGVLLSVVLAIAGERSEGRIDLLSAAPLPTELAVVLLLLTGVLLPTVTFYWHRRVIDEVERDAVREGAVWAIYLYMIGAPVWWLAWRGGFAPEPDGILIFFATVFTMGGVTWWKKHH